MEKHVNKRAFSNLTTALLLVLCLAGTGCASDDAQDDASSRSESATQTETPEASPATPGTASTSDGTGASANASAGSDNANGAATELATPSQNGALHVEGAQLVDESERAVQLRGVSTHGLAWYPQYVNQTLFTELRESWNANVVRLALYTAESGGYTTDGDQAELEQLVLDGVKYAAEADMYVVVDWHILSDANPLDNQDAAVDFFSRISAKLAENDNVIYEICNEPNGDTTWDDIKSYAKAVIPAIRANDESAVVIVGTPTWSQDMEAAAADPIDDENVMYALHFYAATHKDDLRSRMTEVVSRGLPVFVSEFGICDASGSGAIDYDSANEWVSAMDELNVSYICWNLSNKDEASALVKPEVEKTSGFTASDLSEEGAWLWGVLHGKQPAANAADSTAGTGAADAIAILSDDSPLQWSATLVNSWTEGSQSYFQYSLTGTCTEGAVSSWSVTVPFNGAVAVKDHWNCNAQASDTKLVLSNADYNGTVTADAPVSDVGIIVYGPADLAIDAS